MTFPIRYRPNYSVTFGDTLLYWGMDRQEVRKLLFDKYKIGDNTIDLSKYNSGDNSQNIIQRRDIYKNYKGQNNYFFLNFDSSDKLRDLELHHGFDIVIDNVTIDFQMNIEKAANLLTSLSSDKKELSEGEYFFNELKVTIASAEALGGDGNNLAYFYCSSDVTHLVDD